MHPLTIFLWGAHSGSSSRRHSGVALSSLLAETVAVLSGKGCGPGPVPVRESSEQRVALVTGWHCGGNGWGR